MIDDFGHSCLLKWRRRGGPSAKGGEPTWMAHFSGTHSAFLSEGGPSPLWSETFPKRRIRHGTTRICRVRCGRAKRGCASRVPPSHGATARRTGGVLVVRATPPFLALMRHRRGVDGPTDGPPTPPVWGGRSHHSDPWREGRNAENLDPGCPAQLGLPRARPPCSTLRGQPIPRAR